MMKSPQGIRLHIFDLDDTLINTRESYHTAQHYALADAFPELDDGQIKLNISLLRWLCQQFGSGSPTQYFDAFVNCCNFKVINKNASAKLLFESYHNFFYKKLKPLNGVSNYLDYLIAAGMRLALASNGFIGSQVKKLCVTGLESYFPSKSRYISESFPAEYKKPSPYMISLACRDAGIDTSQSAFYGNAVNDIIAGNLAGVTTIAVGGLAKSEPAAHHIAQPNIRWCQLNGS